MTLATPLLNDTNAPAFPPVPRWLDRTARAVPLAVLPSGLWRDDWPGPAMGRADAALDPAPGRPARPGVADARPDRRREPRERFFNKLLTRVRRRR
ncbi:hypothetical protein [Streptomyces hesseae]|uniref:hypothetical protein n=1 Tax=Streptomyces hesseae TaxID=3075519 RepID=UPI003F68B5CD